MDWKALFFSADGRIGRQAFWIGFAILFVVGLVLNVIPGLGHLIILAMTWCWVCLTSKRLHDMGRSGWLSIIPYAIWIGAFILAGIVSGAALVGAILSNGSDSGMAALGALGGAMLILGLAGLAHFIFLLWVGLTAPTPGENAYGPHPSQAQIPTVVP